MDETIERKPLSIVTSSNFEFKLIEEGVYDANITKVEEKSQFNRFSNQQETGIQLEFTIISDGAMKGMKAYNFFNPFLTANSNLTKCTKAIMGREFTPEELATIKELSDLARFLNKKPIQIIVKNRTSARGRTYYTISDYVKSPRINSKVSEDPVEGVVVDPVSNEGSEALSDEEIERIAKELESREVGEIQKATPKTVA